MAMATALVVVRAAARDPTLTLGLSALKNSFTGERSSVMSMKRSKLPQTIPWFNEPLAQVMKVQEFKKFSLLFLLIILMGMLTGPVWADSPVHVVVETVLASQGSQYLDPRLSSLIEELQSLFRYSSYRLLGRDRMTLGMEKTGMVSLPGNRILKITPLRVTGDRGELQLVISRKKKQIFQTVIQLLNHGSIIVGGPKYKDGYLLFNISASF